MGALGGNYSDYRPLPVRCSGSFQGREAEANEMETSLFFLWL